MHMNSSVGSYIKLFQCSFNVVKSDFDVLMSHCYVTRFPPTTLQALCVTYLCVIISHTELAHVAFFLPGILS